MGEDRKARFRRIREQHGPALARVVRSYARPGADEEDLAQEVSLALWKGLEGFRGECSERAFVLRVAHNRGLNHLWRRRPSEALPEGLEDASPRPDAQTQRREEEERLFAAIRQLPPPLRQALTLALEELPHAEIGAALGISEGNVAVRLSRARAALRKLLKEEDDHER